MQICPENINLQLKQLKLKYGKIILFFTENPTGIMPNNVGHVTSDNKIWDNSKYISIYKYDTLDKKPNLNRYTQNNGILMNELQQ